MKFPLPDDMIRKDVAKLPSYNAGLSLDRFEDAYGIPCVAKLDSNENPLGPSPQAIRAMAEAAPEVWRYPDAASIALRTLVAKDLGLQVEKIMFGNGSEDLIGALFRTVIRPRDHVVTICPSFGLHEFGALMFGATVTKVPFNADWSFPVHGICDALKAKPRVLIFSSPSNPVGPAISEQEFREVIARSPPETLICFDEAYVEFLTADMWFDALGILADCGKPYLVLRTFSKAYGLAGVRVGYGIASDAQLLDAMMQTRSAFGVNALAAIGATEAFKDTDHLKKVVDHAVVERQRVATAMKVKGIVSIPSQTNCVFFDTGAQAGILAERMRKNGILIKAWKEAPYESWARVTMGTTQENDLFLAALQSDHAAVR